VENPKAPPGARGLLMIIKALGLPGGDTSTGNE